MWLCFLFLLFERLGDTYFSWSYVQHNYAGMSLVLACMHSYSIFTLFLSIFKNLFFNLVLKLQAETVNGRLPASPCARSELVKSPEVTLCGWLGYEPSINKNITCFTNQHDDDGDDDDDENDEEEEEEEYSPDSSNTHWAVCALSYDVFTRALGFNSKLIFLHWADHVPSYSAIRQN